MLLVLYFVLLTFTFKCCGLLLLSECCSCQVIAKAFSDVALWNSDKHSLLCHLAEALISDVSVTIAARSSVKKIVDLRFGGLNQSSGSF